MGDLLYEVGDDFCAQDGLRHEDVNRARVSKNFWQNMPIHQHWYIIGHQSMDKIQGNYSVKDSTTKLAHNLYPYITRELRQQ